MKRIETYATHMKPKLFLPAGEKFWRMGNELDPLSMMNFGAGCYGIESAAHEFFGISAKELKPIEEAILHAVSKNPEELYVKLLVEGEVPQDLIRTLSLRFPENLVRGRLSTMLRREKQEESFVSTLEPIDRLLVLSLQQSLGTRQKKFPGIILDSFDSEEFYQRALRHAVLPLVYFGLDGSPFRESLHDGLKDSYNQLCLLALNHERSLIEVLHLLSKDRVQAMLLKGITLSQQYYGGITKRASGDIDLFIRDEDAEKIIRLLQEGGYRHAQGLTPLSVLFRHGTVLLVHAERTPVDLHIRCFEKRFDMELPSLWEDAVKFRMNAVECLVPSAAKTFIFVALHGAKHLWGRLGWLVDLALVARKLTALDWKEVHELSTDMHVRTRVIAGIYAAHFVTGLPLSELSWASDDERLRCSSLACEMLAMIFFKRSSRSVMENIIFASKLCDRWTDTIHYILGKAFDPNEAE